MLKNIFSYVTHKLTHLLVSFIGPYYLEALFNIIIKRKNNKQILPISLKEKHIKNARLVIDRYEQLYLLPKNVVCAEIGVEYGIYSQKILDIVKPKKLYLIEINKTHCLKLQNKFAKSIKDGVVEIINKDSNEAYNLFNDNLFDFIYIDGSHTYEDCKSDLENFYKKVKVDGLIILNDYIIYSWMGSQFYGVMQATNEFCHRYNYEIIYYTLNTNDYKDVILRKIKD